MFTRRDFAKKAALAGAGIGMWGSISRAPAPSTSPSQHTSVNPWIELSKHAYWHNAAVISEMAEGRPVLAVLKNNAYGLGDVQVAQILDESPHIAGIALVKEERALAVRASGVTKPILLMADFDERLGADLVDAQVILSVHSYASLHKLRRLAEQVRATIPVELYVDTGLGRMGMPYHQALNWAKEVAAVDGLNIVGTFSTLTTPSDFALEQIERFKVLTAQLQANGIDAGRFHLAPSYSLLDLKVSHMDVVRPGILVHGSFPLANMPEAQQHPLQPTYRLKARVVRVERLRPGDSIGFSRFYTAQSEEWIATVPIGWADGYDSGAENGAKVLVDDTLYPVVNVNASHCNLLIGKEKAVEVGAVATLIGPDRPEITPEGFGRLVDGHNYMQIQYKESLPKYVYNSFG